MLLCPVEIIFRKRHKIKHALGPVKWLTGSRGRICSRCGSLHPDHLPWFLERAEKGRAHFERDLTGAAIVIDDYGAGELMFMLAHADADLLLKIRSAVRRSKHFERQTGLP